MDSLRKSQPKTYVPSEQLTDNSLRFSSSHDSPIVLPQTTHPYQNKHPHKQQSWKRFLMIFGVACLLFLFGTFSFFLYKSFSVGRNIQLKNNPSSSFFSDIKRFTSSLIEKNSLVLRGGESGRINILLLGRAGEHYPGKNLTDTVMIMSIDTANKKVALLSLPRDLYAPIPDTNLYTKINSLYQFGQNSGNGIDPLRSSVEAIIGQKIHYYFILDFDGFEETIDALDGIQVDVVRDFLDPRYPGKNYSYETFEIKKGWQTLDGATALKYVRERHNDPEGDFGRAKRQQQVIQAIKDKAFSLGTYFNIFAINTILDALGKNVETDMPLSDMEKFLSLIKTLDTKNITSIVVDAWKKESLLRVSHIQVGPVAAFILVPRIGNWSEVHDISENIFNLETIKERQRNIKKEASSLTILSLPKDAAIAQKISEFATEEMGFKEVSLLSSSLKNRPEESMIVDRVSLRKPYSLDELIRKFALKKEDVLPAVLPQSDPSDFVLIIGADLADTFSLDDNLSDVVPEDTAFPEILPPQPRKR